MNSAEIASIAREVALSLAAIVTASVAVYGVRRWIVELRGRTSFEVARGMMLTVYRLRDEVAWCRSPMVRGGEFPEDYPGSQRASSEQEGEAWAYVYRNRWRPVRSLHLYSGVCDKVINR